MFISDNKEGKVRMKVVLLLMMVIGICSSSGSEKNHNGAEHQALCDVLKVAVGKWEKRNDLSETLRKALKHTIFGSNGDEDLEGLRHALPKVYDDVLKQPGSRSFACGIVHNDKGAYGSINQVRWSGYSVPHDLVCLCTTGDGGWPLNDSSVATTLCGKKNELGGDSEREGWSGQQTGEKQMESTWKAVINECLKEDETGKSLQKAMDVFTKTFKLNHNGDEHGNRYLLGEDGSGSYPCGGKKQVCVMYYNETKTTQHKPWWVGLKNEINKEEYKKQQKKHEDEVKHKKERQNQHHLQEKDKSPNNVAPRTAALTSSNPEKQEAEQDNTKNISTPIATTEETSGTLLIQPCSWLLSALLLI
ncbi:Variant surface glycoprotein [Trypanosoma congolense IL3000]|uniref:Variant surface glycoprotein n=1 Tax=Trypanosoma congolense (strain IL3000) TaxID=1068625 RepID=F9WDF1_TRYCI|nr:Variant surface glycoprotein [Trypanosoma congolense IL3000]